MEVADLINALESENRDEIIDVWEQIVADGVKHKNKVLNELPTNYLEYLISILSNDIIFRDDEAPSIALSMRSDEY